MILLLNTAQPTCFLSLVDDYKKHEYTWEVGRSLARELHAYIQRQMNQHGWSWQDIEGIGVYSGPGSFTGLRIGITVVNTAADALGIPIVGVSGDDWQEAALMRLKQGENDRIVLPEYGSAANITKPRK